MNSNTEHRVISRHSKESDARKALASSLNSFEEGGKEYAREVGHSGPRMTEHPGEGFVVRYSDALGSGEFYGIVEDAESLVLVSSW